MLLKKQVLKKRQDLKKVRGLEYASSPPFARSLGLAFNLVKKTFKLFNKIL